MGKGERKRGGSFSKGVRTIPKVSVWWRDAAHGGGGGGGGFIDDSQQ